MTRFTLLRCSAFALVAVLASACSGPTPAATRDGSVPFDLEAARRIITEQNTRFTAAHVAGGIATIDSMFTPDAKSYPPGSAAVSGVEALHDFTVEYIKSGVSEFREETTDFYGNAEYMVDAGTYIVTYGPTHVTERGKYLNVWTQVNGRWKIKANMWNTDAPAVPSK